MSAMRLIILLVAAAAAVGAALLVRNLAPGETPVQAVQEIVMPEPEVVEEPKVKVLVMRRDVSVGELLLPEDFAWVDWPEATLNFNYVTEDLMPDALEQFSQSVVRIAMYENEPVLPQKIVKKGETGYMAALLSPGMRAVSVEISTDSASGGFILPNDRVDVFVTYTVQVESRNSDGEEEDEQDIPVTTVILENARVLAIDQQVQQGEGGSYAIGSTATLELGLEEARLLAMAERMGSISLALRSVRDAVNTPGPTRARTDFLVDVWPFGSQAPVGAGEMQSGVTVYRNGEATFEPTRGS